MHPDGSIFGLPSIEGLLADPVGLAHTPDVSLDLRRRDVPGDEGTADVLSEGAVVVANAIDDCSVEERGDPGLMKERIRVELRRFLKKRTGRRPMVLPVVMEI